MQLIEYIFLWIPTSEKSLNLISKIKNSKLNFTNIYTIYIFTYYLKVYIYIYIYQFRFYNTHAHAPRHHTHTYICSLTLLSDWLTQSKNSQHYFLFLLLAIVFVSKTRSDAGRVLFVF